MNPKWTSAELDVAQVLADLGLEALKQKALRDTTGREVPKFLCELRGGLDIEVHHIQDRALSLHVSEEAPNRYSCCGHNYFSDEASYFRHLVGYHSGQNQEWLEHRQLSQWPDILLRTQNLSFDERIGLHGAPGPSSHVPNSHDGHNASQLPNSIPPVVNHNRGASRYTVAPIDSEREGRLRKSRDAVRRSRQNKKAKLENMHVERDELLVENLIVNSVVAAVEESGLLEEDANVNGGTKSTRFREEFRAARSQLPECVRKSGMWIFNIGSIAQN